MKIPPLLWCALSVLALSIPPAAAVERQVLQVADGVHVIRHRDRPFEGGNTTVIIGDRAVLVVDTGFIPYVAREDIDTLRSLTDLEVRYVLNSHWHNDHAMGNAEYARAFPDAIFLAQRETARDMALNLPNAAHRTAPQWVASAERSAEALETGVDEGGRALEDADRRQRVALLERQRLAAADYADWAYQGPTLVFDHALDLDLGGRTVRVEHLGRGNTTGDTVVRVPDAGVVITGDLLVAPLPYVHDGYPSEWIDTLERLTRTEARIVVPGHGPVMADWDYLRQLQALMRSAVEQVDARLHVIGPAEFRTVDEVLPHVDLSAHREAFAAGDPDLAEAFDQTAEQLVRLVFKEASLR